MCYKTYVLYTTYIQPIDNIGVYTTYVYTAYVYTAYVYTAYVYTTSLLDNREIFELCIQPTLPPVYTTSRLCNPAKRSRQPCGEDAALASTRGGGENRKPKLHIAGWLFRGIMRPEVPPWLRK
jgi:hypothetical protein